MQPDRYSMSYLYFQPDGKTLSMRTAEIVAWAKGRDVHINPKDVEQMNALQVCGVVCVEEKYIPMGNVAVVIVHSD